MGSRGLRPASVRGILRSRPSGRRLGRPAAHRCTDVGRGDRALTARAASDGAMLTTSQIQLAAHPIDPLAPCAPGRYADELVMVAREDVPGGVARAVPVVVVTAHFALRRRGRRVEVGHWLRPGELDNNVAGLLADELFAPGWLSGA